MLFTTPFPVLIIMPEIETSRLRLRQFTYDDLDNIYQIWTDPDVRKYLWDDEIISKKKAENTLSKGGLNEDIYLPESFSYNPPLLH